MNLKLNRKLVISLTCLAALAFGGGAYAASQGQPSPPRQAFLDDLARRLGVSPQKLQSALQGAFFDRLDAAVAAGELTKAQADAIKRRVVRNGHVPFGGPAMFDHRGGRGLWGPPSDPPGDGGPRRGVLDGAAKYLGLTPAQLKNQLSSGRSLAQIAQARGKSVSGLETALVAAAKARLDQAVAANRISASQEHQLLSGLRERIGRMINGTPPPGPERGWVHPPGPAGAQPPAGTPSTPY